MADDERTDLDVPDGVGADERVVDARARGPEEVGAVAERIGEQVGELGLLLEDEEAEVMGDEVGEARSGSACGRTPSRSSPAVRLPSTIRIPQTPTQKTSADAGEQRAEHEDRVGQPQRVGRAESPASVSHWKTDAIGVL